MRTVMIRVTVEAIGFLGKFAGKGKQELTFDSGKSITAKEMANQLGIPEKYPLLYMVNKQTKKDEYILADGDNIAIMVPIAGG